MKKTNLFISALAASLLLAACSQGNASSNPASNVSSEAPAAESSSLSSEESNNPGSSSEAPASSSQEPSSSSEAPSSSTPAPSSSSEAPKAPTAWTDEQNAAFIACFGEAIPFPKGASADFKFVQGKYTDGTDVIYCVDPSSGDLVSSYAKQLLDAGWVENEERKDVGAKYTTYVYEKEFNPSRGTGHVYSVQVDYSTDGFEITCDEYIGPATYKGNTWNGDLLNACFAGFDQYQDFVPAYTAAEGNTAISFYEADYHEYMGFPYFGAKIYNTTLAEVSNWFDAISEAGNLYSYVEFIGDDFNEGKTACDNNLECLTAIEGFQHHTYEMFFDEDMCYIMTVNNNLAEEVPYIEIEIMYWE